MIHMMLSTFGLGILGIDPITAFSLLSKGLRNEKKSKISIFFLSFAGFSILMGAGLVTILGEAAVDFLKTITPSDNSPLWAILKFAISIFILVWISKKLFVGKRQTNIGTKNLTKATVNDNIFKYIVTGFLYALSSFTDPTFYAVILISGETGNIFISILLLSIWFLVSQFLAVTVYTAIQFNLLNKLIKRVEKLKNKNLDRIKYLGYCVLILIAILLIVDTGFYLFNGSYLF